MYNERGHWLMNPTNIMYWGCMLIIWLVYMTSGEPLSTYVDAVKHHCPSKLFRSCEFDGLKKAMVPGGCVGIMYSIRFRQWWKGQGVAKLPQVTSLLSLIKVLIAQFTYLTPVILMHLLYPSS